MEKKEFKVDEEIIESSSNIQELNEKMSDKENSDKQTEEIFPENNVRKTTKKKFFNNNLIRLLLALLILCGCGLLGAGIAIYEDKSNPTEYVAEYFGKFLMQRYDEMYDYVEQEGKCITEAAFVNLMSELHLEHNIGDYEFKEPVKAGERYLVKITYKDAETEEDKEFDIYLVKYREDFKQIVADWKISIDEYLIDDFTVKVPEGMALEIDGMLIDENSADISMAGNDAVHTAEGETIVINSDDETAENYKTYHFDKILKGQHKIRAVTDYTQIDKDVDIQMNSQTMTFDTTTITIKDDYLALIETNAPEMIKEYYEVVRNRKTSGKKLLTYFIKDEKLVKKIKNLAKKDQQVIFWPDTKNIDDYNLIECDFSDLKYTAEYIGGKQFKVIYKFSYDYVSATDTALYTSYVYTISGKCTTTMELTYDITDDGIKISDISIKNKNKKEEQ